MHEPELCAPHHELAQRCRFARFRSDNPSTLHLLWDNMCDAAQVAQVTIPVDDVSELLRTHEIQVKMVAAATANLKRPREALDETHEKIVRLREQDRSGSAAETETSTTPKVERTPQANMGSAIDNPGISNDNHACCVVPDNLESDRLPVLPTHRLSHESCPLDDSSTVFARNLPFCLGEGAILAYFVRLTILLGPTRQQCRRSTLYTARMSTLASGMLASVACYTLHLSWQCSRCGS